MLRMPPPREGAGRDKDDVLCGKCRAVRHGLADITRLEEEYSEG